ncbi:MAG: diguanylate cyclase [Candidatus Dormibacteria bacterium]
MEWSDDPGLILVVDDEAANVTLLEKRLRAEGYEVVSAGGGAEAMALMKERLPEMVMLDLMMPGVSGLDVLRQMRENPLLRDVPVVILSARTDEVARVESLDAGAHDFLSKPFSTAEMTARVRNMLRIYRQQRALARENSELSAIATTDALTSLPNRRALDEQFALEAARSRRHDYPLAVALFDVDHFKRVNDSLGHMAGDGLLCHIAAGLRANARVHEMVGRFGGEEFLALLPFTELDAGAQAAERLRSLQWGPEARCRCTLSAGVASTVTTPHAQLLEAADRALYRAKDAGRDQVQTWDGPLG